ncbi:FAD:protein FMN transferase [Methylomonas sp. MK1]|uniref:FAD:protein FMN transferase n=1 Tax=Methylomonas sp. MK1 TaxID=1131552 RepID=UPI0003A5AFE8|nr:FAD:protein FMN transferase [Methylomonas sp. MK1]
MLFSLLLLSLILLGCRDTPREAEVSGDAQGTTYHIKLVLNEGSASLEEVSHQITAVLAEIDAQMSNYREDSEISRLNGQESSDWLSVSPEIAGLLAIADQVYRRSEGCYDLTVKPLFDLWGFSKHENRVPTDQEIAELIPHIGMPLLEIDAAGHRIRKIDPKLKIDLSSIAQGYSVGMIAQRLDALGIEHYLVEIGGEMLVKGRKANGDDWRIGVEMPTSPTRDLQKIIDIKETKGTAIMTAGTYRNFFEDQGQNYSHILNPKTGKPVDHHLRSVTVIHDNPTWADAWDTALLCVGESKAMQIAEAENLRVLLVYKNDNKLKEYTSKAFDAAQ